MAEQIEGLLLQAASADKNAEKTLQSYLNENYGEFLKGLATIISDEGRQLQARQVACLYFKTTLAGQSPSVQIEKHARWKTLAPEIRQEIKDKILQTLRQTQVNQLPHFCSLVLAEIAVVELPYREWPQFLPNLSITSQSDIAGHIKIAALECLGYTCERLAIVEEQVPNVPELDTTHVDAMLTTIIDGVQANKPDKMRLAALQALKNSLFYITNNMQKKDERDFIMKATGEACHSQDPEVRALSFGCLDTICEQYYDNLSDYMTHIYNLTTDAIKGDSDEDVKMAATEVWTTVASVEQEMIYNERTLASAGLPLDRSPCPKYINAAAEHLTPLLLQTLTLVEDDTDEDTWTLQASAGNCLENISLTIEGRMLGFVIPFVEQNITSADWKFRDAAIVAFSSIQEGPTTQEIGNFVNQSLELMVRLFDDPSANVQNSAVYCVGKMCELHLEAIPPEAVRGVLHGFLTKMKKQESLLMMSRCCTGIFYVAQSVNQQQIASDPPNSNVLSELMMPLMQELLNICDRAESHESNLRVAAMSAAAQLVSGSARDVQTIFRELLPHIIQRTQAALSMQTMSQSDIDQRHQILNNLCSLLQTLYQRMEKQDVMEHTQDVMNLLMQVLQIRNLQCHEEALFAIGALAANLETDFLPYMQHFTPLLVQALRSFTTESLVTVSVGVTVDICGALGPALQPFADQVVAALMEVLRDGSVARDVKPTVVSAFGDVAMAIAASYEPYLDMTNMLLMQAAEQSAETPDMVDFINTLRASILEAYSGIIVGLAEGGRPDLFYKYLDAVMQFLSKLAGDVNKDSVVLTKAITLLGDLAKEIGAPLKAYLQHPYVRALISQADNSQDQEMADYVNWSKEQLQALSMKP